MSNLRSRQATHLAILKRKKKKQEKRRKYPNKIRYVPATSNPDHHSDIEALAKQLGIKL